MVDVDFQRDIAQSVNACLESGGELIRPTAPVSAEGNERMCVIADPTNRSDGWAYPGIMNGGGA